MNFTDEDIAKLTKAYGERLKKASQKLSKPQPSLVEIQDWMQKECIESLEVLELTVEKIGKGEKVEKKMSPVRRKNKKSGNQKA